MFIPSTKKFVRILKSSKTEFGRQSNHHIGLGGDCNLAGRFMKSTVCDTRHTVPVPGMRMVPVPGYQVYLVQYLVVSTKLNQTRPGQNFCSTF